MQITSTILGQIKYYQGVNFLFNRDTYNILKYILPLFVVWRVLLILLTLHGVNLIPTSGPDGLSFPPENTDYWLLWSNWDGGHYRGIAENGYLSFQTVFFPFYPLMIKLLMLIGISSLWAGLLISHFTVVLFMYFFYKLIRLDYSKQIAEQAIWFWLIFPTAFYFGALYSESLFLALAIAGIYFARKQNWLLAAILASLSAITRIVGLAILAAIIFEYYLFLKQTEGLGNVVSWLKLSLMSLLVSIPLLSYLYYLGITQGDPLIFISHEQIWHRTFSLPWTAPINNLLTLTRSNLVGVNTPSQSWLDLMFFVIFLVGLIFSFKHLRRSYWLYYLLAFLLPLFSNTLSGVNRYYLVIFPFFILLAKIKNPLFLKGWTLFSMLLLGIFSVLFINSYWVS